MSDEYFTTQFGNKIPIREGYRKGCPPPFDPSFYDWSEPQPMECDFGIFSDIFEFSIFTNWLDFITQNRIQHNKLMDIGGGCGLIARLFKASGKAKHVSCLEKANAADSLPLDRLIVILHSIKRAKAEIESNAHNNTNSIARLVLNIFQTCQSLYPYPIPSNIWNINPSASFELDEYLHTDLYTLNRHGYYDCLTMFSSLDHFSPSALFEKAHYLLCDGGFLYLWHVHWWWLNNPPSVFGDFPYLCQRLTRYDVERYFDESPYDTLSAMKAYDYYHCGEGGYTLNEYINMAYNAGLTALHIHRLIPPNGILPTSMANWRFIGDHSISTLREVLKDIHCFKPDVTIQDLITHSYFIVLRKN